MGTGTQGGSSKKSLKELGGRLKDPTFRASFKAEPSKALSAAGIDATALSPSALSSLSRLSDNELATLGDLSAAVPEVGEEFTGGLIF